MNRFLLIISLICLTTLTNCSSRAPKTKNAHTISKKFIENYAKEYPTSIFGSAINSVTINAVRQESLNNSNVETVVNFENGKRAFLLIHLHHQPILGWQVDSWELLGVQ